MKSPDVNRLDKLVVEFYSSSFPLSTGDDALSDILEIVERHVGELMPTTVYAHKKRVRYSREAAVREFSRRSSRPPWSLYLVKDEKPELLLTLDFDPASQAALFVSFQVLPFDFYREQPFAQERAQRLFAFVRDMAHRFPPLYGYGHSETDASMGTADSPRPGFRPTSVSEVYWLNLYGQEMVEAMGRARVLSTPAAQMEQLPHGGVLLLTRPTPADFDSEEARVAQAKALVHLRPEMSFDAVLGNLRERSAALIPVAKDWDPDLMELLDYTLDHTVKLKDRQRATARLNEYRPPPVVEWIPLDQAPPNDVEDFSSMLEHYKAMGLRFARNLRDEVPQLMGQGPDSITSLDCYLFTNGYGGYTDQAELETYLIPLIGAFLGETMVKHLGGRWVPRKKYDEAYVAIGDRAWLPFLRVRHCLREQQSVVDHSLTKFYREAERYSRAGSSQL